MGDLSQFREVPEGYEPKEGDWVTVLVRVDQTFSGKPTFFRSRDNHGLICTFGINQIVSIPERPIEPECMVNIIGRERGDPYTAEVLSVDRNYAFVLITGGTGEWHHEVLGFDELERIS